MLNEIEIDNYIKRKRYRQINSILVWQDGEIIIERYYNGYTENSRNVIRSVSKSILSICAGICLDKGIIKSLDEPIYKYLPLFSGDIDIYHKLITIRHLLTMTSGIYWVGGVHYHCPLLQSLHRSNNWLEQIANIAMKEVPGVKFNYKEYDVMLLASVLESAIGSDLFDFLKENLYDPLQIKSGRWWKSPCGVTYSVAQGGEGNGGVNERTSNLTAREMISIGQLFLQKGIYNGKRIISEKYINEVITPLKCNKNYGFLWWLGDDWYGCRGFGGQNISVISEKNIVFVMQATPTSRGMAYNDVFDFVKKSIE